VNSNCQFFPVAPVLALFASFNVTRSVMIERASTSATGNFLAEIVVLIVGPFPFGLLVISGSGHVLRQKLSLKIGKNLLLMYGGERQEKDWIKGLDLATRRLVLKVYYMRLMSRNRQKSPPPNLSV
jgi:hypothetical protein